jgi:hypothetical protein
MLLNHISVPEEFPAVIDPCICTSGGLVLV